jgi:hypothetical protein
MKEIEISMVVTCPKDISEDDMNILFIAWVEAHDWTCGGSVKEI